MEKTLKRRAIYIGWCWRYTQEWRDLLRSPTPGLCNVLSIL
jgi:hypothetical protein